jgi:gliding motility-associated-like protein
VYTVTLTARNEDGCRSQATRTYWIVGPADSVNVAIPNAFSPNGDGINDEWTIFAPSMKKQTVEIYGRWGHRVYLQQVEGLLEYIRWDGTYLNQPVPEGVFVYKYSGTTISGIETNQVGTVTIIR